MVPFWLFQTIFEQNCENTMYSQKSQKQGQRWITCLREPTFGQNIGILRMTGEIPARLKLNNLEFSQLLTNLKILSEI